MTRAGATLWLFCFQFFVAEQIVRTHLRGPYSMAQNAISDLAALHPFAAAPWLPPTYSPLHTLMGWSFTMQGLLILSGARLLRPRFPAGRSSAASFVAFTLSGASLVIVGLVPEDSSALLAFLHVVAAALHFLCGAAAMFLLGLALLAHRGEHSQTAGWLSLSAGTVALAATVLLGFRQTVFWREAGLQLGAVERIAAYPLPLWLTLAGVALLVCGPRRFSQVRLRT